MTRPFCMLLLSLAAAGHARADGGEARFAVVVANNRSLQRDLPHLRYADDDGARFHELLAALGSRSLLLSVLDPRTQERFPDLARVARPPRRAELRSALRSTFAAIRRARARGKRTVFHFVFAGHGGVDEQGMGYVHLLDGRLSRADIYREVIAPSPATVNHVIVDACHAYFLLHSRGGWRDDQSRGNRGAELLQRYLMNETLERYPNTGVVLATSSSAETHEWSRFQGGIFSHEVRSAMSGAADVDGDGRVGYSELAAYVDAANSRVTNRKAHLRIFTRPPAQRIAEPVARIPGEGSHRLRLPRSLHGHFYVEDIRGVRFADFNKSPEQPLTLVLPPSAGTYYVRGRQGEARIQLGESPGLVRVTELQPLALSARGTLEEALQRGLYAVSFGRSYHEGYQAAWARNLERELGPAPTLEASAPGRPVWRLGAAYLLTTPVLGREGLLHGAALRADRRLWGPLRAGLELHYASSAAQTPRQQRIAAGALVDARWSPLPWLALGGGLSVGYLSILESGAGGTSGDAAAFTFTAGGGPELRLAGWLWLAVRGRLVLDSFSADGERRTRLAPGLVAGLVAGF